MSPVTFLFSFKGKIGRKLFWLWAVVPTFTICAALYLLQRVNIANNIINYVGYFLIIWIITAGVSKSLRDLNYSVWIQLTFFIPAIATYFLSAIGYNQQWVMSLGYVTFLIGAWISIKAAIIKGPLGESNIFEDNLANTNDYLRWLHKLKTVSNWKLDKTQYKNESKQFLKSGEDKTLLNDKKDINADVLNNWLYNSDPDQSQNIPTTIEEKSNIRDPNNYSLKNI